MDLFSLPESKVPGLALTPVGYDPFGQSAVSRNKLQILPRNAPVVLTPVNHDPFTGDKK